MRYCNILPALLLLVACSQEEPADSSRLPDGAYPMMFTAGICEPEPQSRVGEDDHGKCFWVDGDKIKVKVTNGGRTMETTCTMDGNGSVITYHPQLYWRSNEDAGVSAWYSNITGQSTVTANTVSLGDQSRGPAYVLRAATTAGYGSRIQLDFTHQLAKIIVRIEGEGASCVSSVKINNHTSCTITDGEVSPGTPGLITMFKKNGCFEAGVVPVSPIPPDFITVNDATQVINGITKLEAGKVYTITINAEFPVKETINGHKAVLMRKVSADQPALYFADRNIGTNNPEEAGLYFWWGDVEGHTTGFQFSNSNPAIVTYNQSIEDLKDVGYIDDNNNLVPGMDATRQQWGSSWRMPTLEDMQWLSETSNCTWEWEGTPAGYYVQSKSTGGRIFLPVTGYRLRADSDPHFDTEGFYWTSTADKDDNQCAWPMRFKSDSSGSVKDHFYRYHGCPVRPVSN